MKTWKLALGAGIAALMLGACERTETAETEAPEATPYKHQGLSGNKLLDPNTRGAPSPIVDPAEPPGEAVGE